MAFHILLCDSDIYSPNITIYDEDYDVFSGFKIITILFRVNGTGTIFQQNKKNSQDPRTVEPIYSIYRLQVCGSLVHNLRILHRRFYD